MSKTNPCKVITSVVRFSYLIANEPRATTEGGVPKYSVSLIIPKSDTDLVKKIQSAVEAAYKEGEFKLRGAGKAVPPMTAIKNPLRDGDIERANDVAYKNSYFVNANSTNKPEVVDAVLNRIIETSEIYSGIYGRASITFYAFNNNGNKGIACGLNHLQKIRDGEPLGSKSTPDADFATNDSDDFLG
jgi:hypothetical protein